MDGFPPVVPIRGTSTYTEDVVLFLAWLKALPPHLRTPLK